MRRPGGSGARRPGSLTRRVVAAAVLGVLSLGIVATMASVAAAGTFAQQGWWWRVQSGLLVSVPPPPEVPENGFSVAGAPDGPSAVAALRFDVPEGTKGATLTLTVAEDQGGEQAILLACRAGAPWVPAQAGRWEDRPAADCEAGAVAGVRGEGIWTLEVGALLAGGGLDVVLLPGTLDGAPPGADGSVFSLAFEGSPALVTSSSPPPATTPAVPPPAARPPQGSGSTAPGAAQGTERSGGSGFGTFVPPPGASPPGAPPEGDEAPPPDTAAAEPATDLFAPLPLPASAPLAELSEAATSSGGRRLGVLLALLSVGLAGVFARQRETVPEAGRVGGLGRFAKPREGPPPPL